MTTPSSYLYFLVCAADGAVQLLLSELLPADQSLKLVVSERRSQPPDDLTLREERASALPDLYLLSADRC